MAAAGLNKMYMTGFLISLKEVSDRGGLEGVCEDTGKTVWIKIHVL